MTYFSFKNTKDQREIIIEERSLLLDGNSRVYRPIYPFLIKRLVSFISTDDGYQPFTNNDFEIEWRDTSIVIKYGFGSYDIMKECIVNWE